MMIYKLSFEDGRIDWCTAKDFLHLIKSYDAEFDLPIQEIESVEEISEDEAKTIMLKNIDFAESDDMPEEFSLFDCAIDDDFKIVGSTDF